MKKLHLTVSLFTLILLSSCVAKQMDKSGIVQDNSYGHWQVVETANPSNPLCYAVSAPTHVQGSFEGKRNSPYLMVTRRQSGRIEVSASSGYVYKKGTEVGLEIGKEHFSLKPKDSVAWARGDEQDKQMLEALKKLGPIVVHGITAKGATTEDIYSSAGFKEAVARVRELCP